MKELFTEKLFMENLRELFVIRICRKKEKR